MKRKLNWGVALLVLATGFFTACESYPDENDYVTEQLVAITAYNPDANFKTGQSYWVADSVTYISADNTIERVNVNTDSRLESLRSTIEQTIKDHGMTLATSKEAATVGVTLTLAKENNIIVSYPWWWYGNCYYYFWGCGYYPYYPYSYPTVVGGYQVGTLTMDMFDIKDSDVKAMWTGIVRGLLISGRTDAEVKSAINDCFNQTPALK